jgi:hypothetical protein
LLAMSHPLHPSSTLTPQAMFPPPTLRQQPPSPVFLAVVYWPLASATHNT